MYNIYDRHLSLRWNAERVLSRVMVRVLRAWGPRCDTSDLDNFPNSDRLKGRCGQCLAHETADALESLY